jgi:PncC family amidohydrolase
MIGDKLIRLNLTVALAESCTGGLLAHRITNRPGSSQYFLGGVVAYAAKIKEQIVGVPGKTIAHYGVVSAEVAIELAQGARRVFGTDIGMGVTGVAGPDGGTGEKPVGLVYIGLASKSFERMEKCLFARDRAGNKADAAQKALEMLDEYLDALARER